MAAARPDGASRFQGQRSLQPGMRVQVGEYLVSVQRYLSQGGFAQVYLVSSESPVRMPGREGPGDTQLVLKHMCVGNKTALATVRGEVDHHVRRFTDPATTAGPRVHRALCRGVRRVAARRRMGDLYPDGVLRRRWPH